MKVEVGYGFVEKCCFLDVSFFSLMCIFLVTLFLVSSWNTDVSLKEEQPCCDHETTVSRNLRAQGIDAAAAMQCQLWVSTSALLAMQVKQTHTWSNHSGDKKTQPNFSSPLRAVKPILLRPYVSFEYCLRY